MTFKQFLALTVGSVTLAAPVWAEEIDATIDADGNGYYSYAELIAVFPDLSEDSFVHYDISADGMLDADEVAEMKKAGAFPMKDG